MLLAQIEEHFGAKDTRDLDHRGRVQGPIALTRKPRVTPSESSFESLQIVQMRICQQFVGVGTAGPVKAAA